MSSRSGNHLTRFLLEYITGEATLGCKLNHKHLPLCAAKFATPSVLAHVKLEKHLLRKSHNVEEIPNSSDVLVLCRNPISCVVRQVKLKLRVHAGEKFIDKLCVAYQEWEQVFEYGLAHSYIWYDDVTSNMPREYGRALSAMTSFVGKSVRADRLAEARKKYHDLKAVCASASISQWAGAVSASHGDKFRLDRLDSTREQTINVITGHMLGTLNKTAAQGQDAVNREQHIKAIERLSMWLAVLDGRRQLTRFGPTGA